MVGWLVIVTLIYFTVWKKSSLPQNDNSLFTQPIIFKTVLWYLPAKHKKKTISDCFLYNGNKWWTKTSKQSWKHHFKKVHMTHTLNFKSCKTIPWKSYSLSNHFAAFRSNMVQLWRHNADSCDIWCYWRPIYTISVIFDWRAVFWVAWMI